MIPFAPDMNRNVLYNSHAGPDVYALIRAEVPCGFDLITLDRDDDRERFEKIADVEVVIVAGTALRRAAIEAAPRLRLVHHQGVGYQDTLDIDALAERGVRVALTPAGTTESVAEHAVLLTLATLRRLAFADAELRRGRWHVNHLRPESRDLRGCVVGYVGMGRIGQAVAERMCAFGARGLYCDPHVALAQDRERSLNVRRAGLDEVVARCDILTLHAPGTAETRHLIDARRLASMKPDAIVVNTARGSIVDQQALYRALAAGRLGGAGLDVFDQEPPDTSHPLFELRNVVVTPHISAGTRDSLRAKMRALFENVVRFYAEGRLDNEVSLPQATD